MTKFTFNAKAFETSSRETLAQSNAARVKRAAIAAQSSMWGRFVAWLRGFDASSIH